MGFLYVASLLKLQNCFWFKEHFLTFFHQDFSCSLLSLVHTNVASYSWLDWCAVTGQRSTWDYCWLSPCLCVPGDSMNPQGLSCPPCSAVCPHCRVGWCPSCLFKRLLLWVQSPWCPHLALSSMCGTGLLGMVKAVCLWFECKAWTGLAACRKLHYWMFSAASPWCMALFKVKVLWFGRGKDEGEG